MSATPVRFFATEGLTLTLKLAALATPGTLANPTGGGDACTEEADFPGQYVATVTEALVGVHVACIVDGAGVSDRNYWVDLADTTATCWCREPGIITKGTGADQLLVNHGVAAAREP
jgi:hypothetical protein